MSISCNISYFGKCMFTNHILHLCQSECLCKCLYPHCILHLAVINSGLSVRLASMFDWRLTDSFGERLRYVYSIPSPGLSCVMF